MYENKLLNLTQLIYLYMQTMWLSEDIDSYLNTFSSNDVVWPIFAYTQSSTLNLIIAVSPHSHGFLATEWHCFFDSFTISFTDKEQAKAKLNDHLASTLLPHYLAKFERLMVIFNTFVQFKSCFIKRNHLFTLETFFVISMKQI